MMVFLFRDEQDQLGTRDETTDGRSKEIQANDCLNKHGKSSQTPRPQDEDEKRMMRMRIRTKKKKKKKKKLETDRQDAYLTKKSRTQVSSSIPSCAISKS